MPGGVLLAPWRLVQTPLAPVASGGPGSLVVGSVAVSACACSKRGYTPHVLPHRSARGVRFVWLRRVRFLSRWSYRQRSTVHDRTFGKTPDCVWGGHTILAPLFLMISLVLLLHGFSGTVLVLPLVSQTFFA